MIIVSFLYSNGNRSSPVTSEYLETQACVTPRFVATLIGMLTNLVQLSSEIVLRKLQEEDLLGLIVRYNCGNM